MKFIYCALVSSLVCLNQSFLQAEDAPKIRWQVKRLTLDANEGADIADVNKDGKLDVIAGRSWYAGPNFVPSPLRMLEDWNGYTTSNGEFAMDVDKDGWVDVVSGGFLQTEIYWYKNPGKEGLGLGHQWEENLLIDTGIKSNEGALMEDVDGDGIPEYIVNSWKKDNPMVIYKFSESEQELQVKKGKKMVIVKKMMPSLVAWKIGENNNGHGMAIGDLNNDGLNDVYLGSGWYEQPKKGASENQWKFREDWDYAHSSVPCLIRDMNGDGKNDLVWAKGHDFGLYWWESKGFDENGTLKWKEHKIDKDFSQAHALHWADLDGDGEDELISGKRYFAHNGRDPGGKQKPAVYYYKWDKSKLKFSRHAIDDSGRVGIGLQIRTADLNGDGRLDIAVAGKSGTHVIFNLAP